MRIRSTKNRMEELRSWIGKHKKATLSEFSRETGGTSHQYYYLRESMGIPANNQTLAKAISRVAKNRGAKAEKPLMTVPSPEKVEAMRKETEEFLAGLPKDAAKAPPVTPDVIWYEIELIQQKLTDTSDRLNRVMRLAQARDADQKKMMQNLISENSELRVENRGLRQQVAELTEMINGTPV